MVTDEDLDRFVSDNRDFIERIMSSRREDIFRMPAAAAELTKIRGERFFRETAEALANSDVQRHFMASGFEILAGLTALVQASPTPDFIKDAVSDFDKNLRAAACRTNEDCLVKRKIKIAEPAEETVE